MILSNVLKQPDDSCSGSEIENWKGMWIDTQGYWSPLQQHEEVFGHKIYLHPTRMVIIFKNKRKISIGKNMEELEPSYIVGL